jgi:uncharacterized membrane protein YqhA
MGPIVNDFLWRFIPWLVTLVQHNWPVILGVPLIIWAAIYAYLSPSRPRLLALYGFAVLTLTYEYQKHLAEVLVRTINYLCSTANNLWLAVIGGFLVVTFIPVCLYLIGIGMVGSTFLIKIHKTHLHNRPTSLKHQQN